MITSYITPAQAIALLAELYDRGVFATATALEQQQALNSATMAINNLDFIGDKTSDTQNNEYPRDGSIIVPTAIELACALESNRIIEGVESETEWETEFNSSMNYAGVQTSYSGDYKDNIVSNILSVEAFRLLQPYLSDFRQIGIET